MFAMVKYWVLILVLSLLLALSGHAQDWEKVKSRGMMEFVVVAKEKEADENVYLDAIKQICTQGEYCRIMFVTAQKLRAASVGKSGMLLDI